MSKTDFYIWTLRKLLGGLGSEYFIKSLEITKLRSLYYFALKQKKDQDKIIYYEFGVGYRTLTPYLSALKAYCKDHKKDYSLNKLILFDSFEGLPHSNNKKDNHKLWKKGNYKISVSDIQYYLMQNLKLDQFDIYKGFYNDVLDYTRLNYLSHEKPDIITIDVDYYTSTKTILEWIYPILKNGSIFFFDDIYAFNGDPNKGELGAINDFNKENKGYITPYPVVANSNCYIYSKN